MYYVVISCIVVYLFTRAHIQTQNKQLLACVQHIQHTLNHHLSLASALRRA